MPHYPQSSRVRTLFTRGQPLVFGKGDVVLGNDPEPNGVYYIESGYVKIYTINDDGDELLHAIYGSGELFPISWAYTGIQPEPLLCEALCTCTVWRIARDWFNFFAHSDVEVGYALATQLAHQFRIYSERLDNLEYKKADERVAYGLLHLAARFGVRSGNQLIIDVPLTHEVLAGSINLARESVSRVIEQFEREGIVQKDGSRLIVSNASALTRKLSRPPGLRNWQNLNLHASEAVGK